jgi:hypothetical protein
MVENERVTRFNRTRHDDREIGQPGRGLVYDVSGLCILAFTKC